MPTRKYTPEFKSSIVALYNEGRSANSLPMNIIWLYKLLQVGVKKSQIVGTDANGKPVTRAELIRCRRKWRA